jgi:hypothetical protein
MFWQACQVITFPFIFQQVMFKSKFLKKNLYFCMQFVSESAMLSSFFMVSL